MSGYLQLQKGQILRILAEPGDEVSPETALLAVRRGVKNGWLCSDVRSGRMRTIAHSEMIKLDAADRLRVSAPNDVRRPIDWFALAPKSRLLAAARKRAVDLLREQHGLEPHPRKLLEHFADTVRNKPGMPERISRGSLVRWMERYPHQDGSVLALVNRERQREPRLAPAVLDIVDQIVNRSLRRRNPLSARLTHLLVVRAIDKVNAKRKGSDGRVVDPLDAPSYQTICRIIREVDPVELKIAQEGRHKADDIYKHREQPTEPKKAGQVVAIDHTRIDLHVVSDDGAYLGRPWLITVQCFLSRTIMGYHLTMEPPTAASVVAAMKHAFMPKVDLRPRFNGWVKEPFEPFGIPKACLFDNDRILQSHVVAECCDLLSIDSRRFAPSYQARFKGRIERLFRTLNGAIFHRLKGLVRHRPGEQLDGDKRKGEADAHISLSTLEALIYKFVVDIHPHRFQRHLCASPIELWRRDRTADAKGRAPADPSVFEAFLGGEFKATFSTDGIRFKGGRYGTSKELKIFRHLLGEKRREVACRYDPGDLSSIWVRLNSGKFVKATAQSRHLRGASEIHAQAFLTHRNDLDRKSRQDLMAALGEQAYMNERASNAPRGSRPFEKNPIQPSASLDDNSLQATLAPTTAMSLDDCLIDVDEDNEVEAVRAWLAANAS